MSTRATPNKGLARVKEVYENRPRRAQELKQEGRKIIGYFCCYPPLEMMTAAGLIPYRITGDVREPVSEADACLITTMCPFIRSCFDLAMKGKYDFLDGVVIPHACLGIERIYEYWRYYLKPPYSFFVDVPHIVTPISRQFFKVQLASFKKSLEKLTEKELSEQLLAEAIELHNENRRLIRQLYELRKEDPPLLTGTEMTQIILAAMSLPVEECNELLREIIAEIKERLERPEKKRARLLIWGPILDDIAFVQLAEECGANVVVDDVCFGTRFYWADVGKTEDPLDGLVDRYLDKILCPRTYRQSPGTHQADLDNRFRYLRAAVRDFQVNGIILAVVRYCETHAHDAPDVRDYLRETGLPVLQLEYEYSMMSIAPLRTRIQAFLELIGEK